MLTRRLVVCLDVLGGRVVKGTQFESLRDVGDPAELAARYEAEGADEIVFLDIGAGPEERATLLALASETAAQLFIPLTIGGGIRSVDDVQAALRAGADKVAINSAAVADPDLLTRAAERFGAQCVVASIDARRDGDGWRVWTGGGRHPTGLDAVQWAVECARRGAGEIVLTSIDRDGARDGYDLELTRAVAAAVDIPVIASGGAGAPAHVAEVLTATTADAALVAGILHDRVVTVARLKAAMAAAAIPVRLIPPPAPAESPMLDLTLDLDRLDFRKGDGLVTVVTQDAATGRVLMVAHADREALERTIASGEMHYRSRSRGPWHKGATSGNRQRVVALATDCDGDAVLATVRPLGPACHTGADSCFGTSPAAAVDPLDQLAVVIAERAASPTPVGYTGKLMADRNLRLKKLGEEAAELVVALADGDRDRALEEGADLLYHQLVALQGLDVTLADLKAELGRRMAGPIP